uniref:Pyrin domain-containing protein n=1 Tax=Hucho hucho TaxID=62062 RepID=A0A4W5LDW3_9TELE
MLDVPALLLTTLEELTEEQLKIFQSNLSIGWLLGFPPIPSRQLENADGQDTVDQMVKRYDPEGAVRNTLMILRWMNLDDLAEQLERDHTRAPILPESPYSHSGPYHKFIYSSRTPDSRPHRSFPAIYASSVFIEKPYRSLPSSEQHCLQVRGLVHANTLSFENRILHC